MLVVVQSEDEGAIKSALGKLGRADNIVLEIGLWLRLRVGVAR